MTRQDRMALLALSILWGGSFLFVEIGLQALPPLLLVWLRVAIATVILGLALPLFGIPFPALAMIPALAVMSVLNNILPFSLIAIAQGQITGALASILNATTPLFTVIVAHLATTDERITPVKALGLGLGFGGVVVMLAGSGMEGALSAKLCSLAAAVSYGCAGVFGRRFRRLGLAPLTTAFGQIAASTLLLGPVAFWIDRPWQIGWPGAGVALAVLALAALSTALAYALFFRVLARAGATALSTVTFLIPVSATALGVLFLGERLEGRHLAGFALICLGLMAIEGRAGKWVRR